MELHEALKEYRALAKLTQQQMANKLDIDKSTYAHYESGRRTPNAKKYLEIARILQIPSFPIKAKVTYPNGLLDKLEAAIKANGNNTGDYQEDINRVNALQEVLNDVINARNRALSLDDVPLEEFQLDNLSGSTTVLTATLDARGEQLINKAIRTTSALLDYYHKKSGTI